MRLALAITRMVLGGAARMVLTLGEGMLRRGHDVTLFSGTEAEGPLDFLSEAERSGLRVVRLPNLVRDVDPCRDLAAYRDLSDAFRCGAFDLVHTHTSKAGILGRLAARRRGVPVVHSSHGHIFRPESGIPGVAGRPVRTILFGVLEWTGARLGDHLLTLSKEEALDLQRLGILMRGRSSVIYNAVDVKSLRAAALPRGMARRRLGLPAGAPVVVTAGRLTGEKGHRVLIRAFRTTLDRYPLARLILAGEGPEGEALRSQAAATLPPGSMLFLGARDDIPAVLSAADLFVLPSAYEGFGLAILEAMAVGIPVLATRVGGVPELVLDDVTGRLVPPEDPAALGEAMTALLAEPATRGRLAAAATHRLEAEFSLEAMLDAFGALYERVLRRRGRRAD